MHDETLTELDKNNLKDIADKFNQSIQFINVDLDPTINEKINYIATSIQENIITRFSNAALYRLFIRDIFLNICDRIIYLDADTIVNLDISSLYNEDLNNYAIGAVPESAIYEHHRELNILKSKPLMANNYIDIDSYFNSGVLIIDIKKYLPDYNEIIKSLELCIKYNIICIDQDILNIIYNNNYKKIDKKYNKFVYVENEMQHTPNLSPSIYHFCAKRFLSASEKNIYDNLLLYHFSKTIYFNHETLHEFITNYNVLSHTINNQIRYNTIHLINLIASKNIIILCDKDYLGDTHNVFKDASIFCIDSYNNIVDLVKKFCELSNDIFFIFFSLHFDLIKQKIENQNLTQINFKENVNFINGFNLLNSISMPSGLNIFLP